MRFLPTILLVLLVGCDQTGRYQITAAKGSTPEDDRAWILDTKTGRVTLCYEHAATVKCLHASAIPAQKEE